MRLIEPLLGCRFTRKDFLQINAFQNLVVIEQEENLHTLQKQTTRRA